MTSRTSTRLGAVLGAAVVLLAACTGVPDSSSPQVVNPVGVAESSAPPAITPPLNADPRTMVTKFLAAGATDDGHHGAAHAFLTSEAKQRWSDTTITVVDSERIGNFVNGSVTVQGRKVGALSASGIYTPVLQGNGGGGVPVPFSFGMKQVGGQWRIDTLQNGVILTDSEFEAIYQQRSVYFFDAAERNLVPDPRYTALSDPSLLASWLINQLATGPRPELQSERTELPKTDTSRVAITLGTPVRVEFPGAGQLEPQTRNRLAAQVAITLQPVTAGAEITIVDGGRAVTIPQAGSTRFTINNLESIVNPPVPAPDVFYVRNGGVVDAVGTPLPGEIGNGHYGLTSVALASAGAPELRIAGTSGTASNARLLVGTRSTGLHATAVRGQLSRPAWAPNLDEVWVGDGSAVYRVGTDGKPTPVQLSGSGGAVSGRVTALRFSPEGARVAMVLTDEDGVHSQIWLGLVVRTSNPAQVRVDSLEPISPQGVAVTDVAWNDRLKLFTIGRDLATGDPGVYEVQVDGSLWTPRGISNLPVPDSITVAANQVAWVSAGGTVWAQQTSAWTSRGADGTFCTNPVYLE
jgi:hypothetical protein